MFDKYHVCLCPRTTSATLAVDSSGRYAMTAEVLVSFLLRSLPLILEQASCTDLLYNDSRQLERGKRLIFCGER